MAHGGMIHPGGARMGQNLAMLGGTPFRDLPGDRATFMWYNECVDPGYKYGRRENPGTGHFTQVIWRDSTHVGAARIKAGDRSYVVANYLPAGNFKGKYKANLPQPISGKMDKIMTEGMRKSKEFKAKNQGGCSGVNVRTSTSTSTRTVNGRKTVTKTVKTYHNNKLVKTMVNGVEQLLE